MWPDASNLSARFEPINPAPPVMKNFIYTSLIIKRENIRNKDPFTIIRHIQKRKLC